MCFEEIISCYEAITPLHLAHYYLIQWHLSIPDFINFYNAIFITLHFHFGRSENLEIASHTMWVISYICIIGCTLNHFNTSVNNIVWIRGMSTFSAIDQKRKIAIKKVSIARLSNKEFHMCFCIFGICLWLNKLSISTSNNND